MEMNMENVYQSLYVAIFCACVHGVFPKGCALKSDLVFLLDTSDSIGKANFQQMLLFVENFAAEFNTGSMSRIGVDTYDVSVKTEFELRKYLNKSALLQAIKRIKYRGQGTETAKALRYLREKSLSSNAGARKGVTKVGIIVTDGRSRNSNLTMSEASKLKHDGVKMFAVGYGNNVKTSEIAAIASFPKTQFAYQAKNPTELKSLVKVLISNVCIVSRIRSAKDYIGCFSNNKKNIKQYDPVVTYRMTPKLCIHHCKFKKHTIACLEKESKCFCTDNIATSNERKHSECNKPCSGNHNILCGGEKVFSAYETGYLGCFTDAGKRVISGTSIMKGSSMTSEFCVSYCNSKGYMYAGTQYSIQCFCGNDISRGTKKPENECSSKCNGDKTQTCGGTWRNSVFRTGTNYFGCFEDKGQSILPHAYMAEKRMTNEICIKWCRIHNYKFAGTKNGNECHCGNNFDGNQVKKKLTSQCKTNCQGDSCQKCGDKSNISVYETGTEL